MFGVFVDTVDVKLRAFRHGGGDVELAELRLDVGVGLEVEQGARDRLLELVGLGVVRFHDLGLARCKKNCL